MHHRLLSGLPKPFSLPVVPVLLIALLSLGLLLRVAHLDQKIFWADEVATAIRAAGYTKAEVIARLADGTPHYPADLLAYQQLTPERMLRDTLKALILSPEHAPLYFLLTRFWMQCFGSSVVAIRSFSVLCSLLTLPAVYGLGRELFGCKSVSWAAVALFAISPFFIAYAQEARPYSCWLLTVVLSAATLLRALRLGSRATWVAYTMALILSFYTSLLSLLLVVSQGIYVWSLKPYPDSMRRYGSAVLLALLAFCPWVWVVASHQADLAANTTWMRSSMQPFAMVAIWLYSFAVLFFDVPIVTSGWIAAIQAMMAAAVLIIMALALYRLRHLPRRVGLLIAALCLPIPLILILVDLAFHGQASATPRYLMPCQFGVLLAVAALITSRISNRHHVPAHLRQSTAAFLLGLSLLSGWVNLNRSPAYQKDRNQHNSAIAALLNQAEQPILLADTAQTLDLLSLSHSLKPTVQMQMMPSERLLAALSTFSTCRATFLFNPTPKLVAAIQASGLKLRQIYQPLLLTPTDLHLSLWQTQLADNCRSTVNRWEHF